MSKDRVTSDGSGASSALPRLMAWYRDQCDGAWEHAHGVRIDTLDNPGWVVDIETKGTGTALPDREPRLLQGADEDDWTSVEVTEGVFKGAGGPDKLAVLIEEFLGMVGR